MPDWRCKARVEEACTPHHWSLEDRQQLIGVFTDIDDTLATNGVITPDALQALGDLKAAGLHVIPITGRPTGWSELLARGDAAQGIKPPGRLMRSWPKLARRPLPI